MSWRIIFKDKKNLLKVIKLILGYTQKDKKQNI